MVSSARGRIGNATERQVDSRGAETAAGDPAGYRDRIYDSYVGARQHHLAPADVAGFKPRAPYLKKLIRDHLPADRSAAVLDLGCGHGALLHFAREAGYRHVVGVDRSPQQVAEAKRLGVAGVKAADLVAYLRSAAPDSYDVVVTFDVIEHFAKAELLVLVDEIRRVLKTGGKWIVHVPNGESPLSGRVRYGDLTHEQAFTRESLAQLVLASGFAGIRCFEDAPVPHGLKSAIRWAVWKLIRAQLRLWVAAETGDLGSECIFTQNLLAVVIK